jgi:putative ABC transport system permease protein
LFFLSAVRRISIHFNGVVRQGLNQLSHHEDNVSFQFIGFTLIILFIIVLGMIRMDLVRKWQHSLPKNTPNYFAFNIAPDDAQSLEKYFRENRVDVEGIYPMARGRIISLNNKPILLAVPANARNHNALHRELNLSWMWKFPSDNKIVNGEAWQPQDQGKAIASVEKNLANDLHLKLGDQLTFKLGEETFSATIVSFRTLDWASFHPNFYVIFPPGLLDKFPSTYITSFFLNPNQTILLNQISQLFPNMTIVDVADLLKQVQSLVEKISTAFQYLFLFSLGSGILIFITSLQASMDERRQTYKLLHILGASRNYIYKMISVEFLFLFLLIAGASVLFSYSIVYLLERFIFNM